jgi:hypothetical protein
LFIGKQRKYLWNLWYSPNLSGVLWYLLPEMSYCGLSYLKGALLKSHPNLWYPSVSSFSWAPVLTLSLLCFAARQQCCQYYQYIYGQHYSHPDPARCVKKLRNIKCTIISPRRISSLMLYTGVQCMSLCFSLLWYHINEVVLSSQNNWSPQMQR